MKKKTYTKPIIKVLTNEVTSVATKSGMAMCKVTFK